VCLRNQPYGSVFFANLITHETRWFPPHRWMAGWISRPSHVSPSGHITPELWDALFVGHRLGQLLLPLAIARQRVECGAPPSLYERGIPQFSADDTWDTHVACATVVTRSDRGVIGRSCGVPRVRSSRHESSAAAW
jgi:hypothetical protein